MEKNEKGILAALNHGTGDHNRMIPRHEESCMSCNNMISGSKIDCETCKQFSNWTMQHDMSFTD